LHARANPLGRCLCCPSCAHGALAMAAEAGALQQQRAATYLAADAFADVQDERVQRLHRPHPVGRPLHAAAGVGGAVRYAVGAHALRLHLRSLLAALLQPSPPLLLLVLLQQLLLGLPVFCAAASSASSSCSSRACQAPQQAPQHSRAVRAPSSSAGCHRPSHLAALLRAARKAAAPRWRTCAGPATPEPRPAAPPAPALRPWPWR
jgi:hypothetical protein